MKKARRRPARVKKRKSKTTLLFVLFWIAIIGLSFVYVAERSGQYNELRETYRGIRTQIEREEARNHELQLRLEFDDGDAYIERLARERLGMVRPNVIVFRNIAAE